MTKVIILGHEEPTEKKPIAIEFIHALILHSGETLRVNRSGIEPGDYDHIMLLSSKREDTSALAGRDLDVMYAWRDCAGPQNGTVFLGHFNDGIVKP